MPNNHFYRPLDHDMKVHRRNVHVFDRKDDIYSFIIETWREISQEAIERKGVFSAALSGGKTPIDLYHKLSGVKEMLPWDKTHIFIVDERFVPLEHRDSNYRMLKETLLDHVPIPQGNIHPIPTERLTPQASAMAYEEDLKKFFRLSQNQFPKFDLLLLGIGEDGHTASLFPGTPLLDDTIHLAAPISMDERRHSRITLTLPVINNAKHILFLITGKNKASVLRKIIDKEDLYLPASMVHPKKGSLIFVIDREASSQLSL
jgi:6-phosphogluconolactonase